MKIALVRCPFINANYPPDLGLGYLYASAAAAGHAVRIHDFNLEYYGEQPPARQKEWRARVSNSDGLPGLDAALAGRLPDFACAVAADKPAVVGFSVWESNAAVTLETARLVKSFNKNIIVVLGGPHCFPQNAGLDFAGHDAVDIVVYGEGETPFRAILDSLEKTGRLPADCPGTIVRNGDGLPVVNPPARPPTIDELPIPDFRGFPLDRYPRRDRLFIANSRGCVNRCAYCQVPGMHKFRTRAAANVYAEMRRQMERHPRIDRFEFGAPALNANLPELERFCDMIIDGGLRAGWHGNAFVHPGMSYPLFLKMRKAGCDSLTVGVESAAPGVLARMGKRYTAADAGRFIRECRTAGIGVCANFIVGFPGETEAEFEETCRFVREHRASIDHVGSRSICYIMPATALHDRPEEFGISFDDTRQLKECVSDWKDLAVPENSYENRQAKAARFLELLRSLGLDLNYTR